MGKADKGRSFTPPVQDLRKNVGRFNAKVGRKELKETEALAVYALEDSELIPDAMPRLSRVPCAAEQRSRSRLMSNPSSSICPSLAPYAACSSFICSGCSRMTSRPMLSCWLRAKWLHHS